MAGECKGTKNRGRDGHKKPRILVAWSTVLISFIGQANDYQTKISSLHSSREIDKALAGAVVPGLLLTALGASWLAVRPICRQHFPVLAATRQAWSIPW